MHACHSARAIPRTGRAEREHPVTSSHRASGPPASTLPVCSNCSKPTWKTRATSRVVDGPEAPVDHALAKHASERGQLHSSDPSTFLLYLGAS